MRVLFVPHRDAQHLYPLVPLAWALRAAGHEVLVACVPGLADASVHTGLPVVVFGADRRPPPGAAEAGLAMVHQRRRFPADWPLHPHLLDAEQRSAIEVLGRNAAAAAECLVDELLELALRFQPDLVVHDTAAFAGAVVAAALGVPNVRHLTGVGLRPMELRVGSREPLPEFAALFQRRGLPVRAVPTLTIDPSPPSLRLPVPEPFLECRYVPYNGPGTVPDWLEPATTRPRILLTWGLSVSRVSRRIGAAALDPFRRTVDALSELDAELLLTTTADQLELLGALPAGVRPVIAVPLQLLLPHCVLIAHQAGDGTALTAAALGVPQLAITRKPDPALTGGRLTAVGAGIHLRYQELEDAPDAGKIIRAAAENLLGDPAYPDAAKRLRAEIERQPPPAALVAALTTLAGAGV